MAKNQSAIRQREDLIRQNLKWKILLENTSDFIAIINSERQVEFINHPPKGMRLTDVIGKDILLFLHPEDVTMGREQIQQAYRTRKEGRVEIRAMGPNKQWAWYSCRFTPLLHDGKLEGLGIIATDITQRKVWEGALLESENRYHNLIETANDPILIADAESGILVDVNKKAEILFGRSRRELIGMHQSDLHPPEEADHYKNLFRQHVDRGGGFEETEVFIVQKDGQKIPVEITASVSQVGKRRLIQGVFRDLTTKKATLKQLRLQATATRAADNGILVTDVNGRILWANPAFTAMTGYAFEEIIGRNPRFLKSGEHPQSFYDDMWKSIKTGRVWRGELRNRRKDGSFFDEEMTITPVYDDNGQLTEFVAIKDDISARKAAEKNLSDRETELRQAQKLEAVSRVAGGVAHDLNNVLTAILGNTELLFKEIPSKDPRWENVDEIWQMANRAYALTRQLLIFSRKQAIQPKVLSLNNVVQYMGKMLRRLIPEDIGIATEPDPNLWAVKADQSYVEQVVLNLAVNARDAMPNGGTITFRTRNQTYAKKANVGGVSVDAGEYVELSIGDSGTGIAPDVLSHLFEPFFTTKDQGKGTGLGLSTVYGIVKQAGGHILVKTAVGKGTTFRILWPRSLEKVDESTLVQPPPVEDVPKNQSGTILLVEDEPAVRRFVSRALKSSGYNVLEAESGDEALELSKSNGTKIDVILTDVVMPNMSGPDFAREFKASHPETKVVFMSGYTEDVVLHKGIAQSEVIFLEKPFTRESLIQKIRMALTP